MTTAQIYSHGVPWEEAFSVAQGYSINGTIYIAGQFSHDMQGTFIGVNDIEAQVRQTLDNLDRVLAGFNVTKSNIAELEIFWFTRRSILSHVLLCIKSILVLIVRPLRWLGHRVWPSLIN